MATILTMRAKVNENASDNANEPIWRAKIKQLHRNWCISSTSAETSIKREYFYTKACSVDGGDPEIRVTMVITTKAEAPVFTINCVVV